MLHVKWDELFLQLPEAATALAIINGIDDTPDIVYRICRSTYRFIRKFTYQHLRTYTHSTYLYGLNNFSFHLAKVILLTPKLHISTFLNGYLTPQYLVAQDKLTFYISKRQHTQSFAKGHTTPDNGIRVLKWNTCIGTFPKSFIYSLWAKPISVSTKCFKWSHIYDLEKWNN